MNDTLLIVVIAVVVLLLVAAAVWYAMRKRSRAKIEKNYGEAYEAKAEELGSSSKAVDEIREREKRVKKIELQPLSAAERDRFAQEWRGVQKEFVESPSHAVVEADRLTVELLRARGYPVEDDLQRDADVTIGHPEVLDDYRSARRIAARSERGEASTEELREATVHFRSLFEKLLFDESSDDKRLKATGETKRKTGTTTKDDTEVA